MLIRKGKYGPFSLNRDECRFFKIDITKRGWVTRNKDREFTDAEIKYISNLVISNPKTKPKVVANLTLHFHPESIIEFRDSIWDRVRKSVIKRDNNSCRICGKEGLEGRDLQVDHKLPKSLFPSLQYDKDNLQVCCKSCNLSKGVKVLDNYLNELRHKLKLD
jgi:hypothetical protein